MKSPVLIVAAVAMITLVSATGWAWGQRIPFDTSEWKTDFTKYSVPLDEIMSGGPPKDGIPAIDTPQFDAVPDADKWLKPREPVILLERAGEARAYHSSAGLRRPLGDLARDRQRYRGRAAGGGHVLSIVQHVHRI